MIEKAARKSSRIKAGERTTRTNERTNDERTNLKNKSYENNKRKITQRHQVLCPIN